MTYADPLHHSSLDDVQGLSLGVFLCGIGIFVLTSAGLITGQTAGLAVIIAYLTGYSFGVVFFLINLPFYFIAYKRLGAEFTIKSPRMLRIVPLGERHISFRPNSSTRASSGVMVAHLTPTP